MITALIDTNIVLDVLQQRSPYNVAAGRVWQQVETGAVVAYVAAISFNNVFYIARKQVGSAQALEAVRLVRKVFKMVSFDEGVLDKAIELNFVDLEDAIQAASAVHVNADYVVTRDIPDFANSPVKALSAEDFLAVAMP